MRSKQRQCNFLPQRKLFSDNLRNITHDSCRLWLNQVQVVKIICHFQCFSSYMGPSITAAPPSPPFVLSSSNRFPPATHNSLFFPFPQLPIPPHPLLVQCPVSTGAFEQFEIKANNGQALPGTSRSPYYAEDARVLLRIIGKSLRFSGNRERELAQRNRWCKQQLSAWTSVCVPATAWGCCQNKTVYGQVWYILVQASQSFIQCLLKDKGFHHQWMKSFLKSTCCTLIGPMPLKIDVFMLIKVLWVLEIDLKLVWKNQQTQLGNQILIWFKGL